MAKKIQALRGMNDFSTLDTVVWQWVESNIRKTLSSYGYGEVRNPIIESTALFKRGVGEATDIVEKEMFTFTNRDGELITLRPEGTAGCVRSAVEHGWIYNNEQRMWYMGPMFRYERPQKGRYRQFHQCGVEVFGINDASADAELILLTANLWKKLGIDKAVHLEINSIGGQESRQKYRDALVTFLEQHLDILDEDCKRRLTTNPIRILDTKNQDIQAVLNNAPKLHDFLNEEEKSHFAELCNILDSLNISYTINQKLVRGLDYYNKTVFEWITSELGAQGTICGGGRYDGLVELLGGHSCAGVGFAMGMERLVLLVQAVNSDKDFANAIDIYVVNQGDKAKIKAFELSDIIRNNLPKLRVMQHTSGGSFKKQFKRADKLNAKFALVLGDNEIENSEVILKDLQNNVDQMNIKEDQLIETLQNIFYKG